VIVIVTAIVSTETSHRPEIVIEIGIAIEKEIAIETGIGTGTETEIGTVGNETAKKTERRTKIKQ